MTTTIESSDPYVTITDASGYFGSLPVDSTKENNGDPYTVYASPTSPDGHPALFRLIAVDGWWSDTLEFTIIIGRIHYYIWNPDPTPAPGEFMHTTLASIGYSGNYGLNLPISDLDVYSAVFVCAGIYSNNYILGATDPEVTALVDYVNNGGRMYLEGGDTWYYDPLYGGYDFGPLFGINATSDGSSDCGPVAGQNSTFTTGMNFNYSGENAWIDHISPTTTGFLIFYDTDNAYDCGVANDAGTYRTVGSSFELGGLVDGSGVSTRAALLDSIMNFFGIPLVGVEENTQSYIGVISLQPYPNPFHDRVEIQYTMPSNTTQVQLKIFDAAGRLVKNLELLSAHSAVPAKISWDGRDINGNRAASGIYFIHMETDTQRVVEKIILIE
ncbi:MAG: FlgD immunoglobulin-like domain containing protein [bacterium]